MNRRAFLKLFAGGVAIAAIPIPKFLVPKEQVTIQIPKQEPLYYNIYRGAVLTPEALEAAALAAAQDCGKPDMIIVGEMQYKLIARHFGYKIVYE